MAQLFQVEIYMIWLDRLACFSQAFGVVLLSHTCLFDNPLRTDLSCRWLLARFFLQWCGLFSPEWGISLHLEAIVCTCTCFGNRFMISHLFVFAWSLHFDHRHLLQPMLWLGTIDKLRLETELNLALVINAQQNVIAVVRYSDPF